MLLQHIKIDKFKKEGNELNTILDQWQYAMKHANKLKKVPAFLNVSEIDKFFYLARKSNFKTEERDMFRTKQQVGWDNKNTANFAGGKQEGREEGALAKAIEIALGMVKEGVDIEQIAKWTKLSKEQILAL